MKIMKQILGCAKFSAPKLILHFRKASQQAAIRAAHQFDGGLTIFKMWHELKPDEDFF